MSSNTTVEGYVDYWNAERKFGFAYVRGKKVFIHLSNYCEVEGTPEEPVLTGRRCNKEFHWNRLNRNPTMLVMRVAESPKGLRAIAWGVKPQRSWLEELAFHQLLGRWYSDGEINFRYGREPGGRHPHREVIGRLTAPVEMKLAGPGVVEMKLCYEIHDGHYGGVKDHEARTFRLDNNNALRCKELPHGRYAMDIHLPLPHGASEWLHLVFYPTWHWEEIK
jgi:hypothetical protein